MHMTGVRRELFLKTAAVVVFALVAASCIFVMIGAGDKREAGELVSASGKWTCSMCPQFILSEPGKCPKCFMDLIPLDEGAGGGSRFELYLSPEAVELAGITTAIVEPAAPPDGAENGGADVFPIPASAVLVNRGRSIVFVESIEEDRLAYTIREIGCAAVGGDPIPVTSGLAEGEAVVVSGAFRIDSAMQILGKVSLANLPDGELSGAEDGMPPPYQPAERSSTDIRAEMPDFDLWFNEYEQIRAALARDENSGAERPSRELAAFFSTDMKTAGETGDIVSRLTASSGALAGAADLDGKRSAFESVTADMVLLARRFGPPGDGLNLVFCPMAFGGSGAYWLQPGETVDNPYHGLEMPTCGWMVDSIQPFAAAGKAELLPPQE